MRTKWLLAVFAAGALGAAAAVAGWTLKQHSGQETLADMQASLREFAHDATIFCRSEALLASLRALAEARAARCQGECGAESEELEAERSDLEQQKDFNLRKLRRKWPEAMLRRLDCAES